MAYTEIKERAGRKYYYRVKSVRQGAKVGKKRIYLGVNLDKGELAKLEKEGDEKLMGGDVEVEEVERDVPTQPTLKDEDAKKEQYKKTTFKISKEKNFSEWYTEIVKRAELGDLRYNVKGFLVFQPWSVLCMEKMYDYLERVMRKKGHKPYWFPTVIPEENFEKESGHVAGFKPEVFWLEKVSGEGKMALRPTSETAFYQMFALWIRSYKDLPFKTYQRANVFRYETKATRPFLRSREFHWVEGHCAHATEEDAMKQVYEDMKTTIEVLHDVYGLPFIFFERPSWDKFPGAKRTFASDVLNPDGKLVQQPSTHLLKQDFAKAFDVKFKDKDGTDKFCWITCYGPAISRIFASVVSVHGDDKGLRFPWKIAPLQVVIVPFSFDKEVLEEAEKIKEELLEKDISVEIDLDEEKRAGEKFYYWEMKGVPLRIEVGKRELKENRLTIYRRDVDKKEQIGREELINYVGRVSVEIDKNLTSEADSLFKGKIVDAESKEELKEVIEAGKIARCGFCSIEGKGEKCAGIVEKDVGAFVRGRNLKKENVSGKVSKCVVCGKKAEDVVYVARAY